MVKATSVFPTYLFQTSYPSITAIAILSKQMHKFNFKFIWLVDLEQIWALVDYGEGECI